jgi:hypothetical protein
MSHYLKEWDTGDIFGPASEEDVKAYQDALLAGKPFIQRGYHGFTLKMVVISQAEKERLTRVPG